MMYHQIKLFRFGLILAIAQIAYVYCLYTKISFLFFEDPSRKEQEVPPGTRSSDLIVFDRLEFEHDKFDNE